MCNSSVSSPFRTYALALLACIGLSTPGVYAGPVLPLTDVQPAPTPSQQLQQFEQNATCIGTSQQPNVTRWLPNGRVWPGGKIVFEGQNLDASRFAAAVGSSRILLTIVSASPTRIETQVPILSEGGPYTKPTGEPLVVSYPGGCKVLNPTFVVAEAFTVQTHQGGGPNKGYFSIRHQMDLTGEIEGARTVTILTMTDSAVRSVVPDPRGACDWAELRPSGRTITLTDNRIQHHFFGYFRDHRQPVSSLSAKCKLPVNVAIHNPFTNISQNQLFLIPMILRIPRTVSVDSRTVIQHFDGTNLSLALFTKDQLGGPFPNCGRLFQNSPSEPPTSNLGVSVKDNDWVFFLRSGVLATRCRFVSRPVEANLGVAFGSMKVDVTHAGDAGACSSTAVNQPSGDHELSGGWELACDPGPLGDNGVTVRVSSIDLLVPHEYMPSSLALEVQD